MLTRLICEITFSAFRPNFLFIEDEQSEETFTDFI